MLKISFLSRSSDRCHKQTSIVQNHVAKSLSFCLPSETCFWNGTPSRSNICRSFQFSFLQLIMFSTRVESILLITNTVRSSCNNTNDNLFGHFVKSRNDSYRIFRRSRLFLRRARFCWFSWQAGSLTVVIATIIASIHPAFEAVFSWKNCVHVADMFVRTGRQRGEGGEHCFRQASVYPNALAAVDNRVTRAPAFASRAGEIVCGGHCHRH